MRTPTAANSSAKRSASAGFKRSSPAFHWPRGWYFSNSRASYLSMVPVLGSAASPSCAHAAGRLPPPGITSSRPGASRSGLGISNSRLAPRAEFAPPVLGHLLRGLVHTGAKLCHILVALDFRLQPLGDHFEGLEDLRIGPRISLKHILRSAEDPISELPGELAGQIRECDDVGRALHRLLRPRAHGWMRLRGKGWITLRQERVLVHDQHLPEAKLFRPRKRAEHTQVLNGSSRA